MSQIEIYLSGLLREEVSENSAKCCRILNRY